MDKLQGKIKKEHATNSGAINNQLINKELSYAIRSRALSSGCLMYQQIVMNDGTIYELKTNTASTFGVLTYNIRRDDVTQKEMKNIFANVENLISY